VNQTVCLPNANTRAEKGSAVIGAGGESCVETEGRLESGAVPWEIVRLRGCKKKNMQRAMRMHRFGVGALPRKNHR